MQAEAPGQGMDCAIDVWLEDMDALFQKRVTKSGDRKVSFHSKGNLRISRDLLETLFQSKWES